MAKRKAPRQPTPEPPEHRINNAFALWFCAARAPAVLAPIIRPESPRHGQ